MAEMEIQEFELLRYILQILPKKNQCLCQCIWLDFSQYLGRCTWGIASCVLIYHWGRRLDRCPVSSRAMAAQAAAEISLCFDAHGSDQAIHLELCMTLTPKDKPSKCPQQLVIMTPAHLMPSSRCRRITSVTAFLWDRVTASKPAGKVGGLLCFLQPLRFWDDPCFSANSGLANLISGKVSECNNAHGRGGWKISFCK